MVVDQTVQPPQQESLAPLVEAGAAEAPALLQDFDGDVVHEQVASHGDPPHQPDIIAPIGVLKTAVEVFDGGATALYPDTHGCILLSSSSDIVL
jgi:hypothetical protein